MGLPSGRFFVSIDGIMETLLGILRKTEAFFTQKGVESPRLNAELIFAHVLGLKRLELYLQFDRPLEDDVLDKARPLVGRRAKREPLQYILGQTQFADVTLACDARALIPRPETEELVELLKERFKNAPPAGVIDLGTGTGAIALALAKAFPEARVWACDQSTQALSLAQENAARNDLEGRVAFFKTDWFAGLPQGKCALVVSNPPYLTTAETAEAAPEVRDYEPGSALVADEDGLADLKKILREARAFLEPGGLVALETGIAHHEALTAYAKELGYARTESRPDISGRPRFFFAHGN